MCFCGQPNVNGTLGYRWQPNDTPSVRPVNPPAIRDGDFLCCDEPGRCGGLDAHSHHYRLVRRSGSLILLVRHGGGDEEFRLSDAKHFEKMIVSHDSTARYWLLHTLYYAYHAGEQDAAEKTTNYWRKAAAEKRIKTRKAPHSSRVTVWIEWSGFAADRRVARG